MHRVLYGVIRAISGFSFVAIGHLGRKGLTLEAFGFWDFGSRVSGCGYVRISGLRFKNAELDTARGLYFRTLRIWGFGARDLAS